jgi:DnaJ homolog subfamily A member 2
MLVLTVGVTARLRTVGPGLVTQETAECSTCQGTGEVYKDKDKCKKCKGKRVVETKKVLELYIPPGSKEGDKIVLAGEADQLPDQEPGDIIFDLKELPHDIFERNGANLKADIHVTLAEALTGLNRVVLKHLDGRGISINVTQPKGKILRPNQILKVAGEGMPIKRSESKGDLFLVVTVDFPEDGWLKEEDMKTLRHILPPREEDVKADVVDEVEFEEVEDFNDYEGGEDGDWEDDDEGEGGPQCATQ